jgi:hypothetical protein
MRAPWTTRQRWRARGPLVVGIALGIAGLPAVAHAAPSVSVSCELLSHDERASVEVRARADLAVKGLNDGSIELTCADGQARVEYAAPGRATQHRSAPSAGDSKQLLERLLALLDEATSASREAAVTAQNAEYEPPPVADSEVAAKVARSRESPRRKLSPAPRTPAAPPSWRQIEVGVGISSEFWVSEVTAAVGPKLGVGLTLYPKLRARLTGALLLASHRPEDIASRLFLLGAEAEWRAVQRIGLAAGANLSQLVVVPRPGWSPSSQSSLVPGLHARLELHFPLAGEGVVLGPEIVLRARGREVELDGRTILDVPAFCAGFLLELRLGVPLR